MALTTFPRSISSALERSASAFGHRDVDGVLEMVLQPLPVLLPTSPMSRIPLRHQRRQPKRKYHSSKLA
jgi:hypothetical protein